MKKYQKQKCQKHLQKQIKETLTRKTESIEKGIQYYKEVKNRVEDSLE